MKLIRVFLTGLILVIVIAVAFVQLSDTSEKQPDEALSPSDTETVIEQTETEQVVPASPISERVVDLTPPAPVERAEAPPVQSAPKIEAPNRTHADLERMISVNRATIDMCYSLGVMNNPSLSGTIVARIAIEANGRVSDVQWTTNTLRDATFEQCLRDEINAWRFEPAGDAFVGEYAFTFSR